MNKNIGIYLGIFIAALLAIAGVTSTFNIYIDWLFFDETGFTGVFKTILSTKILSGLFFGTVFLVFYLINIYYANKISSR